MRRATVLLVAWMAVAGTQAADVPPSRSVPDEDLKAIAHDEAAATKAVGAGDAEAALRYYDYFGHEQEAFARALIAYQTAGDRLHGAVVTKLGGSEAWRSVAPALRLSDHRNRRRRGRRSARAERGVIFLRNAGGGSDVPYVKVDGVWKVSVREVVHLAIKSHLKGRSPEEVELHAAAGKLAGVVKRRAEQLVSLARDVESGKIATREALKEAAATPPGRRGPSP